MQCSREVGTLLHLCICLFSSRYGVVDSEYFGKALSFIMEGIELTKDPIRYQRLLLMVKIEERDIYEAFRLTEHMP